MLRHQAIVIGRCWEVCATSIGGFAARNVRIWSRFALGAAQRTIICPRLTKRNPGLTLKALTYSSTFVMMGIKIPTKYKETKVYKSSPIQLKTMA